VKRIFHLFFVSYYSHDLLDLILAAAPKLNVKGAEGKTPKEVALAWNNPEIASRLQKAEGFSHTSLFLFHSSFLNNLFSLFVIFTLTLDCNSFFFTYSPLLFD
jgi:hypothetical protein